MDAAEFLAVLAKVPDLLDLARQQEKLNYYPLQERLREQYRREGRPFLWSMPLRHLDFCDVCRQAHTAVLHELEDPASGRKVAFSGLDVHCARQHGTPPPQALADFLAAGSVVD